MLKENSMIQDASQAMREAFESGDATAVQSAFEAFGSAIAAKVQSDFESANGDKSILAQRGFRVLTSEETKYYEAIIDAGKKSNPKQVYDGLMDSKIMPKTVIEDVYKNLTEEHPLLNRINFQSVEYLTRWILNDHTAQTAVWGPVNSEITEKITSAFKTVEVTQCKLSAYAVIEKDMLDLGPSFLDNYIRTFLKEALAKALEKAIVSGTGKNQPIGLDRDIHEGVSVSDGAYPKKEKISVTSFIPEEYGKIVAKLARTEVYYTDSNGDVVPESTAVSGGALKSGYKKHGGALRKFDSALLICNQEDYLTKIMPATTVLTTAGTYANNLFPFPTEVERSNEVDTGTAILCLPEEYFFGLGSSKEGMLEYSDDYRFLEDQRVFKIKMHGYGKAWDNTVAVLLDIRNLDPAYITVKTADKTPVA